MKKIIDGKEYHFKTVIRRSNNAICKKCGCKIEKGHDAVIISSEDMFGLDYIIAVLHPECIINFKLINK